VKQLAAVTGKADTLLIEAELKFRHDNKRRSGMKNDLNPEDDLLDDLRRNGNKKKTAK
jgi:hypothetical protein